MKALTAALAVGTALSALTLTSAPSAGAASAKACGTDRSVGLEAVALTASGALLCVDVDDPADARTLGKVSGLDSGTELIGIDYRPENGKLYGVAKNGSIYTISAKNAKATKVATMSETPSGASFGVDFNPVVDRLRIVSDTGQNLRVDVSNGATTKDTGLTNPVPPPGMGTTEATGVTGAAYTNNDKIAKTDTATTLFDLDTALDRAAIQSPANAGTLAPTGKLGINAAAASGFDVYSSLKGGQARNNVGYAALSNGTRSSLYRVDLLDGSLKSLGKFTKNKGQIIGLALPLNQR
ncbi:DUF4394 domain-containing protein [Sporichthya sp.]|uniref:DUF4394 domain-containing protein n=1 Tax=Sporichthya sp. TaxID=65475 RepID=UPI00179B7F20|nr:DUF4394 domain-containing protein [Sporichthya sp.]MBA3743497.1 DUF4394 domain-containing protein [Sporichthya sp.]